MRRIRYTRRHLRGGNWLMQIVAFVVGLGVLGVSLVLGAFLLAALLGVALILGVVAYLRLWWLGRRRPRQAGEEDVIETEYRVVRRKDRGPREP